MNFLIHLLEFVKYKTFSNILLKHYNNSAEYIHYKNEQIITPEGLSFFIKNMRFNFFKPMEKNKENYINVDWGNVLMQPSISVEVQNSTYDKIYIFHSNEFLALSDDEKARVINFVYANANVGGFWGHLYSVVIQIAGNSTSDFETFMSMSENTWQLHFNNAVSIASNPNQQYRNFKYILKYHPDILKEKLSYQDRVKLLEVLAYEELWDFVDEVDEQEFALLLLETTPANEEYALYQKMFEPNQNTILFKAFEEKFDDAGNLKFAMILVRFLYNYKKSLGINVLEDFIDTIPQNYIIPIRKLRIKPSLNLYGPEPIISFSTTKVNLIRIDFYIGYQNQTRPYTVLNPDPFEYLYHEYDFNEMVKVFIWRTNEQVGLDQGRIIPLPAFAVKAFHNAISDDITLVDVISKIVETVGIILPYMKLLQIVEMGALWYEADLLATSVATANAFGGLYISYLEPALTKNQSGINFLKAYNYLAFIYGTKDLKGLIKNIRDGDFLAISDAENLMSLWGLYQNTTQFNPQPFTNTEFMKQYKEMETLVKYSKP